MPPSSLSLLAGRTAMLNVIPYNPVAGLPYETPSHHRPARIPPNSGAARHQRSFPPSQGRRDRRRLRPVAARRLRGARGITVVGEGTVGTGRLVLRHSRTPTLLASHSSSSRLAQRELIKPTSFTGASVENVVHDLLDRAANLRERSARPVLRECCCERRLAFRAARDIRRP